MKKALIFDLDNTIYPVPPYAEEMFASFMQLLSEYAEQRENVAQIKKQIMRKGFLLVAAEFNFNKELTKRGNKLFQELTYSGPLAPFDDFSLVRKLPHTKFLVTAGYEAFQQSKISALSLQYDFEEIHIVDASKTNRTKKDVFADIISQYRYGLSEILVIGDDLDSEIKAGQELGLDVLVYDQLEFNPGELPEPKIKNYADIDKYLY
jgi:putative hydrolase of the HAD superfamily